VYPALAVLEALVDSHADLQVLWVGGEGGMEADLVANTGVQFETIPAAGVHGVGLRALPANILRLARGFFASRKILRRFKPDVLFFTGGYVAVPMALAGVKVPSVLYVPDIEPGLALKTLARFAERIALTTEDSREYFPTHQGVVVTGYPTRKGLISWDRQSAREVLGLRADLPTLLVIGGSKGARSINRAVFPALPELLIEMQIIHLTGELTWPEVEDARRGLAPELDQRYHPYPYLHKEIGAAFKAADLVLSRAGASSLGEFPLFGLSAILVPYPYAWRYQKVNAEYLVRHGAAIMVKDQELPAQIVPLVRDLIRDVQRRTQMADAMRSLNKPDAAESVGSVLVDIAGYCWS
jgi:UDP-N-acetylglucosamine--N-acetylmuramyl-(pentapeptide) pyrophosphoryl-undecaprenol N-acetylglucosamine transferase